MWNSRTDEDEDSNHLAYCAVLIGKQQCIFFHALQNVTIYQMTKCHVYIATVQV
jgi:hypothetical protein